MYTMVRKLCTETTYPNHHFNNNFEQRIICADQPVHNILFVYKIRVCLAILIKTRTPQNNLKTTTC